MSINYAIKKMGLLLLLSVWCTSCGGSTPVKHYYMLANQKINLGETPRSSLCAMPVVLASVTAASPYDEQKVVFRSDTFEIRYYNYRFWVSPPEQMLKSLVSQKLDQSGTFTAVESYAPSASEYLALHVSLNSIEEIDLSNGWNARLAMGFALKSSDDDAVLWKHEFDITKPVGEEDINQLIKTLSDIYNLEINQMVASLKKFVKIYDKCRPSPK